MGLDRLLVRLEVLRGRSLDHFLDPPPDFSLRWHQGRFPPEQRFATEDGLRTRLIARQDGDGPSHRYRAVPGTWEGRKELRPPAARETSFGVQLRRGDALNHDG